MENGKRYILIGFMGAGKTFLGKQLAIQLELPFIDSDEEIEKEYNSTINQMFENEGEEAFRLKEQKFIVNLKEKGSFVLSTGGGMPCFSKNMELLNELGTTIYLKLSSSVLTQRLLNDNEERPLIVDDKIDQLMLFIKEKLSVREQFYNQSQIVLDEKSQNVSEILKLIKHG
jgi:shikimate kinase